MKKIMIILLFWSGSVCCMCMSAEEYYLWLAKQEREFFYSEVPQADSDDGVLKACDFLHRLQHEQMACEITFQDAYKFHMRFRRNCDDCPKVVHIIERFFNSVIARAFFMQEGNGISDALEVVKANAYDRAYIFTGRKNRMMDEDTFNTKLDAMATLIKNTPRLSVDE